MTKKSAAASRVCLAGLALSAFAAAAAWAETVGLDQLRAETHFHGVAVDPADPSRILLATHHGFFAVDAEGKATRLSPVQDFMGFTPHPTDPTILYASGHPAGGGNLGFIASSDGGASWTMVSPGVGGPVDFHQMDVSPADPNRVYGVFGTLQVSRDGGKSFEIAGPVPAGVIDLAAAAGDADLLFVATETGLYRSADAGASWSAITKKDVAVSMVEISSTGEMYVFVPGYGLLVGSENDPVALEARNTAFGDSYMLHLGIDRADPTHLVATTQDGLVLVSRDGGVNWVSPGGQ